MKMIKRNNWAQRNRLNISIPITDSPIDLHELIAYSPGRLSWFYYRLGELVIYSFLNREDDYFNESD